MEIISKNKAYLIGYKKYYTGKPCKHGHFSERYTSSCVCVECSQITSLNRKDKLKEYRGKHPDRINASRQKHNIKYASNRRESRIKWRKNNRHIRAAGESYRRAKKLKATPKWANLSLIAEHYKECKEINLCAKLSGYVETFEVDHIVPLQGKNVCGLHVEYNLQILTASKNRSKSNKY